MGRINYREVSFSRIVSAIRSRLIALFDFIAWKSNSSLAEGSRSSVRKMKGRHEGETCIIIANGPSINKINMKLLDGHKKIGMNRAYLMADSWGYIPDYLVCINELVISQFHDDFTSLKTEKIINWRGRSFFGAGLNSHSYVRCSSKVVDMFSYSLEEKIYTGGTVTYACLQLAYYLGFKKVYLVGLDHNFVDKGRPNKTETRTQGTDENHFHPDYFPKGVKWQLPDLVRSEIAYKKAREVFENDGREIYDLTLDGKCDVFIKKDIRDVFGLDVIKE